MKQTTVKFWQALVRYFVAGVLAILPLVVTIAIVTWVSSYVVKFIGPSTMIGNGLKYLAISVDHDSVSAYFVGWVVVLVAVFILGALVELGAKSFFHKLFERLFAHVPLVGSIYRTSKQVVEMLDTSNKEAVRGMSAVFCYFGDIPGPNVLALLVSHQKFLVGGVEYYIIMIPTAPVPFGGAMMLTPIERVVPADISVDGLMSIYLSMGITAAEFMKVSETPSENIAPKH
ncbi:MAG: DUF502 domain-containing protein [Pirellulales bacterium]